MVGKWTFCLSKWLFLLLRTKFSSIFIIFAVSPLKENDIKSMNFFFDLFPCITSCGELALESAEFGQKVMVLFERKTIRSYYNSMYRDTGYIWVKKK